MASQAPIIQGVCKRFDAAKGFGYITVSDGLGEVFVHQKEIKSAGCQLLKRGDLVQFNVVSSGGGGRKAVNVVLMEPVSDGVNIDVKVVVTPNPAVRAVIEQIEGATPKVDTCCGDMYDDEAAPTKVDTCCGDMSDDEALTLQAPDEEEPESKEEEVLLTARARDWLKASRLGNYADALCKAGVESIDDIDEMEDDEVAELIDDADLPKMAARKLKRAVAAVQSGKYEVPNRQQKEDPETVALRKSRAHLKGKVEIPKKRSSGNRQLWYTDVDPVGCTDGKNNRVVIFIGQTGAGKTTLIQSLTNYLEKVDYDEPLRYDLICEEKDDKVKTEDVTKSQTVDITMYHMHNVPVMPADSLTIVDSPGFGDTAGPKQDLIIRGKFKEFFESVPYVDAIYFVVKASTTRIGASQKYLFNMVLDLFGNDVKKNIFLLFTFADGGEPPALKAVDSLEIPYAGWFKLNNSGFSMPGKRKDPTHRNFYNMGCDMFAEMMGALKKTKKVSTSLCKETLKERDNITARLFEVGQVNKTLLTTKANANQKYQALKKFQRKMDDNKDFTITTKETRHRKVYTSNNTTYCTICVRTCHSSCIYGNNEDKKYCGAMRHQGQGIYLCTVCPKKCSWADHQNTHELVEFYTVEVKQTKQDLLAEYNLGKAKLTSTTEIMAKVLEQIKGFEDEITQNIARMKSSVDRLQKIALNNKVLTDDEYFDTLIDAERKEGKLGYMDRIDQLEQLKAGNKDLRRYMDDDYSQVSALSNDADLKQMVVEVKNKKKFLGMHIPNSWSFF